MIKNGVIIPTRGVVLVDDAFMADFKRMLIQNNIKYHQVRSGREKEAEAMAVDTLVLTLSPVFAKRSGALFVCAILNIDRLATMDSAIFQRMTRFTSQCGERVRLVVGLSIFAADPMKNLLEVEAPWPGDTQAGIASCLKINASMINSMYIVGESPKNEVVLD